MCDLLNFHLCSTEDKTEIVLFPNGSSCSSLGGTYRKKSFTAQEYLEGVLAKASSGDVATYIRKAEL